MVTIEVEIVTHLLLGVIALKMIIRGEVLHLATVLQMQKLLP